MLETVTAVLQRAGRPMGASEVHEAAENLAGGSLKWTSVKAALAAGAAGAHPSFRRVRYGVYELRG